MSSYLFSLNVPYGENPLSKLTRWTSSLDLDYLGIEQPNLLKFFLATVQQICSSWGEPIPIVYLSVNQWANLSYHLYVHGTPSWGGPNHAHTMHRGCPMDHSPWLTIMVLMFLVGRTHHHYKPVNDPLETMGIDYSLWLLSYSVVLDEDFKLESTYLD